MLLAIVHELAPVCLDDETRHLLSCAEFQNEPVLEHSTKLITAPFK